VDHIEAPLWISVLESLLVGRIALVDLDLATLVADSLEDFLDLTYETCKKKDQLMLAHRALIAPIPT
jgi:hypothetical protein